MDTKYIMSKNKQKCLNECHGWGTKKTHTQLFLHSPLDILNIHCNKPPRTNLTHRHSCSCFSPWTNSTSTWTLMCIYITLHPTSMSRAQVFHHFPLDKLDIHFYMEARNTTPNIYITDTNVASFSLCTNPTSALTWTCTIPHPQVFPHFSLYEIDIHFDMGMYNITSMLQTQVCPHFSLYKSDIHFDMDIYDTMSNIHVKNTSVSSLSLGQTWHPLKHGHVQHHIHVKDTSVPSLFLVQIWHPLWNGYIQHHIQHPCHRHKCFNTLPWTNLIHRHNCSHVFPWTSLMLTLPWMCTSSIHVTDTSVPSLSLRQNGHPLWHNTTSISQTQVSPHFPYDKTDIHFDRDIYNTTSNIPVTDTTASSFPWAYLVST